jgi:hypothetical protein
MYQEELDKDPSQSVCIRLSIRLVPAGAHTRQKPPNCLQIQQMSSAFQKCPTYETLKSNPVDTAGPDAVRTPLHKFEKRGSMARTSSDIVCWCFSWLPVPKPPPEGTHSKKQHIPCKTPVLKYPNGTPDAGSPYLSADDKLLKIQQEKNL